VRLPRDWLGPREELVPIGAATRARADGSGEDGSVETLPPTAHDFWGEDSAALHDAMQATPFQRRLSDPATPAPRIEEPRSRRRPRPHLSRPAGLEQLSGRRRWLVLGLPATAVLVALALIGGAEGPAGAPSRLTPLASPVAHDNSARVVTEASATLAQARSFKLRGHAKRPIARPTRHARSGQTHTRHSARRASVHHSSTTSSSSALAATQRAAAPATTYTAPTPTVVAPAQSAAAAGSASHRSSAARQPAFGPKGALAPGSSPDS
jgi:hypothetical protein